MGTIAWLWSATFAWVCGVPLLLARGAEGAPGVAGVAYAFAWIAAIAVVVAPSLRRAPLQGSMFMLLACFLALRSLTALAFDGPPPSWPIEAGYVGIAVALAARLGRVMDSADDALAQIAEGRERDRVAPFEDAQQEIYREIRRARRYERPASLIAFSAAGMGEAATDRLMREVQQALARRYAEGQLAKMLLDETDAAALITRRGDHFVVLLPEAGSERARRVAERLATSAADRWGLSLCSGIASFPDQEVTFEGLLERAESQLRSQERTTASRPRLRPVGDGEPSVPAFARENGNGNGSAVSGWPEG